jgi:hypothetical protein
MAHDLAINLNETAGVDLYHLEIREIRLPDAINKALSDT